MYTPVLVKIKKHHGPQNSAGDDACPSGYERPIYHSCHSEHINSILYFFQACAT